MPDHCTMWTCGYAVHTPPTPAHIQKRAFIPVKTAEGIPAADISGQANLTRLAQIIIHFQHKPSCTFNHISTIIGICQIITLLRSRIYEKILKIDWIIDPA